MCVSYRGTDYHYGIAVEIPQEGAEPRCLSILMTKHLEDLPYVYGGICLDNGLEVVSTKLERHAAFCDIIEQTIDVSLSNEGIHLERFGAPFVPFKNLLEEYPNLRNRFEQGMAKALPLEEYKKLKTDLSLALEKQKYDIEEDVEIPLEFVPPSAESSVEIATEIDDLSQHYAWVLYDCKDMILAYMLIQRHASLHKVKIKAGRLF